MFMMRSELAFRLVVFATEYRSFEERPRRRRMSHYGDSTTTDRTRGALSPVDRAAIGGRDLLLLAARLALGAIFLWSGFGKLTNLGGFVGSLTSQGMPLASVLGPLGACIEFFGSLAIVLGAWTRLAAFAMVGFTIFATAIAHRYWEAPEAQRMMQQIQFMK